MSKRERLDDSTSGEGTNDELSTSFNEFEQQLGKVSRNTILGRAVQRNVADKVNELIVLRDELQRSRDATEQQLNDMQRTISTMEAEKLLLEEQQSQKIVESDALKKIEDRVNRELAKQIRRLQQLNVDLRTETDGYITILKDDDKVKESYISYIQDILFDSNFVDSNGAKTLGAKLRGMTLDKVKEHTGQFDMLYDTKTEEKGFRGLVNEVLKEIMLSDDRAPA